MDEAFGHYAEGLGADATTLGMQGHTETSGLEHSGISEIAGDGGHAQGAPSDDAPSDLLDGDTDQESDNACDGDSAGAPDGDADDGRDGPIDDGDDLPIDSPDDVADVMDAPPEDSITESRATIDVVQAKSSGMTGAASETQSVAARGVQGSGGALPFLGEIQASFGPHDVSGVRAHVSGIAAEAAGAIGASAYATGNDVAFADSPDLFTAAHEAAHVVQQRAGVQLLGGVGEVGDTYERNADAAAGAVMRGESASHLLGGATQAGNGVPVPAAVQRKAHGTVAAGSGAAAGSAGVLRKFLGRLRRRMPARSRGTGLREAAIHKHRAEIKTWLSQLAPADARDIALAIRPGGALYAEFKYRLATAHRREITALLGGKVTLPGADGQNRGGIGLPDGGVDASTVFDPRTRGREDEFIASGNLAVQIGRSRFRLWGFDVNSAIVRADYSDCLQTVARLAIQDKKAKIRIEGHTSGSGREANNGSLSAVRATAVATALVSRGVARQRIVTSGSGSSSQLFRSKRNPAAMARNRRVEIYLKLSAAKPNAHVALSPGDMGDTIREIVPTAKPAHVGYSVAETGHAALMAVVNLPVAELLGPVISLVGIVAELNAVKSTQRRAAALKALELGNQYAFFQIENGLDRVHSDAVHGSVLNFLNSKPEVYTWLTGPGLRLAAVKEVMKNTTADLAHKIYNPALRRSEALLRNNLARKFPRRVEALYKEHVAKLRKKVAEKVFQQVGVEVRRLSPKTTPTKKPTR